MKIVTIILGLTICGSNAFCQLKKSKKVKSDIQILKSQDELVGKHIQDFKLILESLGLMYSQLERPFGAIEDSTTVIKFTEDFRFPKDNDLVEYHPLVKEAYFGSDGICTSYSFAISNKELERYLMKELTVGYQSLGNDDYSKKVEGTSLVASINSTDYKWPQLIVKSVK